MILIDNNFSHRIGNFLSKEFLGIKHVSHFGMDENTTDAEIWAFSKAQHFTILTKDTDFEAMSRLFGCPPKVIQLTCGNKSTSELVTIIGNHTAIIKDFIEDKENCLMFLQ